MSKSSINSVKWIYELDADFEIDLRPYITGTLVNKLAFEDMKGKRRLVLHPDGKAIICKGYTWDGCTPKYALYDVVFGISDGVPHLVSRKPKAYSASLVHDVLYQFLDVGLPIARADADRAFLDLLTQNDFAARRVYWLAVRLFGGMSRRFTRWKRSYRGRRVVLSEP